ncbi:unnamed protein product [Schistosoma curassoni]|uniref:Uridine kinase n=1 Tax=Schistosoma curassoni TaxID=6186 RepID=A0A183JP89_9TREM|nr:unnamed protein product [Schistosoma curassoni]
MKRLYDTTKKRPGKYSKPERPVTDKEGKSMTEIKGQGNRWVKHFEELLNRPAPLNSLYIDATPTNLLIDVTSPAIEGIRMVIRKIKSGKAAGPGNIPAEAPKSDTEEGVRGRISVDGLESRVRHQDTNERRSEQPIYLI